ncbi:MAG: DUF2269 family protein [Actinomycetota bacterium]|nr:DUF2269 family protein [Actinomycetota bacterium]
MELRDLLLVLHIAGAGTWLGANIVQAVVPAMAFKQAGATASGWYRIAGRLSTVLYMPAAILILVTGIVLVLQSEVYSFGSFFVTIGFTTIVIGALLGILVFGPVSNRAADAIDSGDEAGTKAATSRLATFGAIDSLLLLTTITVMVLRLTL